MIKKLLISSLFFTSAAMCMEFVVDRDQVRLNNNASLCKALAHRITQRFWHLFPQKSPRINQMQGYPPLTPAQLYNLDEDDETDNIFAQNNNQTHCTKIVPFTILATFAASMLVYKMCNTH